MKSKNNTSEFGFTVISNIYSDTIKITEDKLNIILSKHIDRITKANKWKGYSGICLSIFGMFVTSDFHGFLGIPKNIIQAIFVLIFLLAFFFMLKSIWYNHKYKSDIKSIIQEIKGK